MYRIDARAACIVVAIALASPQLRALDIAVFYALEADLKALRRDALSDAKELHGTMTQSFRVGNHRVVAAKMGVGNSETAVTAATVLASRRFDLAFSIGPAGALTDDLAVGQFIQAKSLVAYQRGTMAETGWGLAETATLGLEAPRVGASLGFAEGALAAGDAFIANAAERERIRQLTGAIIVDMNSYGLSISCARVGVPLVIAKIVSDKADQNANEAFRSFVASYKGTLGEKVREAIEKLPPSPDSPSSYPAIRALLERE